MMVGVSSAVESAAVRLQLLISVGTSTYGLKNWEPNDFNYLCLALISWRLTLDVNFLQRVVAASMRRGQIFVVGFSALKPELQTLTTPPEIQTHIVPRYNLINKLSV
jgi:hypothetical protein